jgi:hypothetical protein
MIGVDDADHPKINAATMKELTGGEEINARLKRNLYKIKF